MAISITGIVAVFAVLLALALLGAGVPVAARAHARLFPNRDSLARNAHARDHDGAAAAHRGGFAFFRRYQFNPRPSARWTLAASPFGRRPPSAPAVPGVAVRDPAAARRAAPAPQMHGPP